MYPSPVCNDMKLFNLLEFVRFKLLDWKNIENEKLKNTFLSPIH